ncbi:MetQ/NlpA family ABC transporter substrate-binding protein [Campylobacter sp. JMF_15 NE4]|uniref:MetQ/NlpA family ABC transporter substrate-binding protein n=1 Tax=unclassified Campylobacter TaxID=2593542 RepID=UPI0022E9DC60|nr:MULTISPECIES: MetQ/NlpA family ABC transporter substrate-binding protein [unclassified Campylobacter]MDA3049142.1 MetQ/NlpA family ABC transporter substrate-binding protein [Campylobacter sp. JMF_15 NE4]MDA3076553.1 MetQ/NlpA family ABC transporter substrate-binding protein [Campylobacter sp. JMF_04 NA10]
MKKLFLTTLLSASVVSFALAEKLVVAATPVPHAEILEHIAPELKAAGYELEVKVFNDYVTPNLATDDGSVDANYFQHEPYLVEFNAKNGTKLKTTVGVHLEPMGIYSKKITDLKDLKDGAKVAVPNDPTNESRALDVLVDAGLIEVNKDVELRTALDVTKNPKNIQILELEGPNLPRTLDDVDIAVINSNFAFNADLNPVKDSLFIEKAVGNPYTNIVVVKEGNENLPKIKALDSALQSESVKKFIEEKYKGAIVPSF